MFSTRVRFDTSFWKPSLFTFKRDLVVLSHYFDPPRSPTKGRSGCKMRKQVRRVFHGVDKNKNSSAIYQGFSFLSCFTKIPVHSNLFTCNLGEDLLHTVFTNVSFEVQDIIFYFVRFFNYLRLERN